jgi:hypothetical protein
MNVDVYNPRIPLDMPVIFNNEKNAYEDTLIISLLIQNIKFRAATFHRLSGRKLKVGFAQVAILLHCLQITPQQTSIFMPWSFTTQNFRTTYKLALMSLPPQKFAKLDIMVLFVTGGANGIASINTMSIANVIKIHQLVWK